MGACYCGARLALTLRVYLQAERREFPSVSAKEASQPGILYIPRVGLTEQKQDIVGMSISAAPA
jgi:hypothetical protein